MKKRGITIVSGLMLSLGVLSVTAESASSAVDGKVIFDRNCSVCHSVQPPPKSAPPILPIAAQYHRKFTTRKQGTSAMVSFMKTPSKQKSVVEMQAITRYGLMPPMTLSDAELTAVAGWVWDQYTPGMTGPGTGTGRGAGQGDCQ